ncbi:MAG: hypothetical protein RI922_324 [Bacteroidota bacterium]|jgi:cell division septation protein DedD
MNQYLLSILREVNTIIIPGVGALTITNAATGEIMFMPYLKFDDGKLAQHISEKEGMELNDAKNLVAKYVREIEAQLNIGESYDMYQFGSFYKNSEGEIEFKPWNGINEIQSSETLINQSNIEPEPTTDNTIDNIEIVEEPIQAEPLINEPEISNNENILQLKKEHQEKETEDELDTASSVAEFVVEETIHPVISEIREESIPETIYTEEQQWNDDLDLPPINSKIERPKKPIIEKVQKDKKRKSSAKIIIITFAFLLIGGGTTVVLMRNQLGITIPFFSASKESTEVKSTKSTKSTVEEETTTETEPTEIDETVEKSTTESPVESVLEEQSASNTSKMIQTSTGSVNPSQPFHVIAGAFKEKSNAERFRDRLRESGNSNSEIIGEFDGLFMVSVTSRSNLQDAQEAQKTNTTISKSWIFRFP